MAVPLSFALPSIRNCAFMVLLFVVATPLPVVAQLTAPSLPTWNVGQVIGKLAELGYWTDTIISPLSHQNKQAIIAFQKVTRLKRSGKLTDETARGILNASLPSIVDSMSQCHIEIDLNRQVLFVIDSTNTINRILTISSGNGQEFLYPDKGWEFARTPRGRFQVYYKVSGWKKSELGMMLNPIYFYGGFAIHGSTSVPAKPASHGCVRVPLFASSELFENIPIGTPIIIYGQNPIPK